MLPIDSYNRMAERCGCFNNKQNIDSSEKNWQQQCYCSKQQYIRDMNSIDLDITSENQVRNVEKQLTSNEISEWLHQGSGFKWSCPETQSLLVFGYGSLVWLPKFAFHNREVGYVHGFVRRFWQGNISHRGVPGSPGRVVTLVPDDKGVTWGVTFHLKGKKQIEAALRHLVTREMINGGYEIRTAKFYGHRTYDILTFVAMPDNAHYLGPAPVETVAATIVNSRGRSGHNLEYIFNLIDTLRREAPQGVDNHLTSLEEACHRILCSIFKKRHRIFCCSDTNETELMTDCRECLTTKHSDDDHYIIYCFAQRMDRIRLSSMSDAP
ncbi:putative glutathione-specific gamma-glutamylcyclotransferase 2 isoform X1 [Ciona intestinalis]